MPQSIPGAPPLFPIVDGDQLASLSFYLTKRGARRFIDRSRCLSAPRGDNTLRSGQWEGGTVLRL
jgi:hypothetical protein